MLFTSPKYAIYTAIVGGYDEISQPAIVDGRFDYILFSNDVQEERVGIWQVRPIAYNNEDNTRICRYIKTHPEEFLVGYEFSIWIDSNVKILTPYIYERSIDLYQQNIQLASMNHIERNCIYEEAFVVFEHLLEFESIVLNWCQVLRKQKYPKNNGLFETNVLFRMHTSGVYDFNKLWWSCIVNYSRRDQLSFNYVLWKLKMSCDYILPYDINTNNSKDFERISHAKYKNRLIKYNGGVPNLLQYLDKFPLDREKIKKVYFWIYGLQYPRFWLFIIGYVFRIKSWCKISKKQLKKLLICKSCFIV